jgi:hypothetical protein
MLHNGTQSTFATALLARAETPAALRLVGDAETLERRFGVYPNNVFASLVTALTARFPAVAALVGDEFFRGMAAEFVAAHPPASPVLLEYGGGFPAFVAGFPPARDIPYLSDVAAFEWTRHEALHAADSGAVSLEVLAKIEPARLGDVRLTFHPAARLFASDYPVVSLWRINVEGASSPDDLFGAEATLIARPDVSVRVHDLTAGAYEFLTSLSKGAPLAASVASAQRVQSDFDLAATLALIFSAGAIASVTLP